MIDHKKAFEYAESRCRGLHPPVVDAAYLDLRRLVKEYFDAMDDENTPIAQCGAVNAALRAAIWE